MKLLASALLLYASNVLAQGGATVEGTVTDSVTHAGVPGVNVTLFTQKGVRYNAATDSSGTFRITGVDPGEYNARYEKPGFEERELPRFGQPRLRVGLAGTVHADVELSAMATLRGRVLDPEGKPASKVTVEIGYDSEETDAEGRFEFKELRPGTYTLKGVALPAPGKTADALQIVPTYYPSTANQSEAERILVRGGADLAGYEIRLRTSSVYHVRGVVLDETGKPAANANVKLLRPQGDAQLLAGRAMIGSQIQYFLNLHGPQQEAAAVSRDDGTFEFPAVRPGDWSLSAESDPQHDANNRMYFVATGTVPTPVSDHDVENVELRFGPNFSVEVTADWGDQQPPANYRPNVMLIPSPGPMLAMQSNPAPGGRVAFGHMVPGRYRIVPTPGMPPGFYAAAVMLGGRDVIGQEVELSAATPEIRVVYRPNPGSIRGTVEQGEGATVLLWPEGASVPPIVRFLQAGAHGAFEFANVPPGDYSVVAFDHIGPGGGSEPYVRGAIAAGARVKVQEGGAESVQLTLTHWPD